MNACRGCASARTYLFLPLGSHPLANGFLRAEELGDDEPHAPLDAYVCLDCGLIQIADNVPPGFFRNYVYVPSSSEVMHDHFAGLARVVGDELLPRADSLAVDIGCNDGLFLGFLHEEGRRTLGVDPATNIVERARARGVEVVNEYFDPSLATQIRASHGPAAAVVTTNTFHHIGDLDTFTRGVSVLLDDDGVFVIEVPHALQIVRDNQFDGIYHEHVSQFTVRSIADHGRRFGLELVRVDPLPVHGGSIRAFLRKAAPQEQPAPIRAMIAEEDDAGLFSPGTYDEFRKRAEAMRHDLVSLLREIRARGARIAGYGASARGNTVLNFCGIRTDLVEYIVDRNELKHELYTPGTHIPVLPVERLLEDHPDYVLVLAWNFADEVLRQQAAYRAAGGRFILPIPEPVVVP